MVYTMGFWDGCVDKDVERICGTSYNKNHGSGWNMNANHHIFKTYVSHVIANIREIETLEP